MHNPLLGQRRLFPRWRDRVNPKRSKRAQVSRGVMAGLLLHRVQPIYPDSAKECKIQGVVVVSAISTSVLMRRIRTQSGQPSLIHLLPSAQGVNCDADAGKGRGEV